MKFEKKELKKLIDEYGSWIRVQVAFYDFVFISAIALCPKHFIETATAEAMSGGFADGEDLYERSIKKIEELYPSFEMAWKAFVANGNTTI